MYHFENTVLCNDTLKILYDPLYGQLSARCDHFCPSSERVKLLTSHRVWSKNDRIYLDLVRDPSTTRNMIAFPEFSNRLPWNSIEHITVFDSKSGKIRKRKTKSEREVEGKSKKIDHLAGNYFKPRISSKLVLFIKTWEFNFCVILFNCYLFVFFLSNLFVSCRKITISKVENTNKCYIEESSTEEYLKRILLIQTTNIKWKI